MTDLPAATFSPPSGAPGTSSTSSGARAYWADLPTLRRISASGADAIEFLHGQLTQDVQGLADGAAALAGYCTAKGRLLATLVMWRPPVATDDAAAPRLHALVRADVAEPLLKRLRMFVLRAKVTLSAGQAGGAGPVGSAGSVGAASAVGGAGAAGAIGAGAAGAIHIAGVWTEGDPAVLDAAAGGALPRQAWQRAELSSGTWIAAPSAQGHRWWWIATDEQRQVAADLRRTLAAGDAQTWQAADLAAGIPWVGTPTQDLFIPQTVNLDLIGGVSFTKGCYPGQEVVARSHYRGTVKRRMAYGVVAGFAEGAGMAGTAGPAGTAGNFVAAGTDVFDATDPKEPCGRVVDAVTAGDTAVLFETTLSALSSGALRLGSAEGPAIQVRPLPYALEPA